jgi:acyl carrier protein
VALKRRRLCPKEELHKGAIMSNDLILEKINEIFKKVFDDERISVDSSSSAVDIDEWDSLNNIQIIIAVEKEFKIRFKSSEIRGWNNVGEMCDAILTLLK